MLEGNYHSLQNHEGSRWAELLFTRSHNAGTGGTDQKTGELFYNRLKEVFPFKTSSKLLELGAVCECG